MCSAHQTPQFSECSVVDRHCRPALLHNHMYMHLRFIAANIVAARPRLQARGSPLPTQPRIPSASNGILVSEQST